MPNSSRKGINRDDKNGQWRGDQAKYTALHAYVRRHKPKPDRCESCNKETDYLELAFVHPSRQDTIYTRLLEMYNWYCRKCHMTADGRINRFHDSKQQSRLGKLGKGKHDARARARATDKKRIQHKPKPKK